MIVKPAPTDYTSGAHRRPAAARAALIGLALGLAVGGQQLARAQGAQIMPNYRNADILQVIEQVGEVTGKNFLTDPRVRAQVNLFSYTPMTADAFYQAFLSMLRVNGFVALPAGDIITIIPDANARQMPGSEPRGAGDEIVTQVVAVDNISASTLVPILRPLVATYGHLVPSPASNMLIITDRAANVRRVVDIVRRMDQAGSQEAELIPLENASSAEVVRMLGALVQADQAGGAPQVQLVPDERTNSVLLSGPENRRLQYRAYIAYLDMPSERSGDTEVRYLNYASAEDLAMKLQTQFGGAAPADAAAGASGGTVNIWPDEGTNALVISAPAPIMQEIMAVVDKIDIRRAQVKVDAIIVEISEQLEAELGVTWVSTDSAGDQLVGLTNFGSGGILQLATAAAGDTPNPAAIAQGLTLAGGRVRDVGTSWAAILSALRGDADTNVISTPTVVTMDNAEAQIEVGQEVPFLTGQFTNTGASAGSVNPFQTIQREKVGTRLKITPQINEGSGVRLTIEQETSSISAGAAGAVDLVTNNRTITTSVFVDDGDVLVLGGLIDDQLLQSEQRVPVLGKIPGLGALFRHRRADRKKTNLMVFIRPTILRDSIDARFETNTKYNYIRDLQRQQAEEKVRLMRNQDHPVLPALPSPAAEEPDGDEPR